MNHPAACHDFNLIRMALDLATGGRPSNIAGKQDALAALAELEAKVAKLQAERDQLRARFAAITSAQIYWAFRNGEYIELIAKPEPA